MVARARIIGIGSDQGDDRVGWMLLEGLLGSGASDNGIVASRVRNPLDLLAEFDGTPRVYLIDGCVTGAAAGTLSRLRWPDARIRSRHRRSSHALSVADALLLAEALGELPGEVVVFGIELGSARPGTRPSVAVVQRLPRIRRIIWREVASAMEADGARR